MRLGAKVFIMINSGCTPEEVSEETGLTEEKLIEIMENCGVIGKRRNIIKIEVPLVSEGIQNLFRIIMTSATLSL